MRRTASFLAALAVIVGAAAADTITLTSGNSIECQVLQESAQRVTFRKGASTFTVPRSEVASIRKDVRPATRSAATLPSLEGLPTADQLLQAVAKQPWAADLEQIPATVIDKGILRNVPYTSHRAGDYEVNVYGNPDAPAGIEVGVYRRLLDDPAAKEACVRFVASALGGQRAAAVLRLKRDKDSIVVGSYAIEVTPPTDEDAYGGWWITVYSEKALEASRASAEEMKAITRSRQIATASTPPQRTSTEFPTEANRVDSPDDWSNSQWSKARPSSGGGGTVYVRDYYRKDGTYVHSYTRSAPGSRSGGRR